MTAGMGVEATNDRTTRSESARRSPRDPNRALCWAARAWIAVVVAAGIATLPRYGLTCDEGLGNLFFGERYLHFFISLDGKFLDFDRTDLPIHDRPLNLARSPWRRVPWAFPPLADTLSAASMELFAYRLGWLDPVDAFHLMTILLVAVLLWCLHAFASARLDATSALLAVVMLGAHPRFWGDMHNNPKDIPEAVFFSLAFMALVRWHESPGWKRALAAGALAGAALAVKVNALFLPLVVAGGLWSWKRSLKSLRPGAHLRRRGAQYGAMIAGAAAVFLCSWPYLYRDPAARLWRHFAAFASQGERTGTWGWNRDPLLQTVSTMPEVVLLLLAVGTVLAVREVVRQGPRAATLRAVLAWMLVPVLRTSVPGAVNFDGIRHFVEFLPAAALLAGYAGSRLVGAAAGRRAVVAVAVALALAANLGVALARYHPYEAAYFNSLVGGLRGARHRLGFPEATDYWGSSYRQGCAWLRRNAPAGSAVYVPVFPWLVYVPARLWLPGRTVVEKTRLREVLAGGHPLYVMFVTRTDWYDGIARHCEKALTPVHQVVVDGVPVLQVYRISGPEQLPARLQ